MAILEHPLDFERPLVELEIELERLKSEVEAGATEKRDEFAKLEQRATKMRKEIYGGLTPYQRVQLGRHFDRPFTLDLVNLIVNGFVELHGDRLCNDDRAIVCGLGSIGDLRVMIVGHQRGRTTQERLERNFGMPQPDGYRKALRMFHMAEKFRIPVITFIDTQGAFPGMEAEERGQAEAIAKNLLVLADLTTPVISVVIGEGGSGGALALGVADKILMLENSCYSVITPEGCASILWHGEDAGTGNKAAIAAEALKLTAQDLKGLGVIDEVIPEPLGGAHWNHREAAEAVKAAILRSLMDLSKIDVAELKERRYKKFRALGPYEEVQ